MKRRIDWNRMVDFKEIRGYADKFMRKFRKPPSPEERRAMEHAVSQTVNRIDFNIATDKGKILTHIRKAEFHPEDVDTLQAIGSKALPDGNYPTGALTWQDYYDVCRITSTILPGGNERFAFLYTSPEDFVSRFGTETGTTPSSPIRTLSNCETDLQYVSARVANLPDNKQALYLAGYAENPLVRTQIATIYDKLTASGLKLLDNIRR